MQTMPRPFHKIANLWPLMSDAELDELAQDIKEHGLLNPIWLYEGEILDGRNRELACLRARIKPEYKTYTGDSPTAFAWSQNEKRRHMLPSQRAAMGAELMPQLREEARKRMVAGKRTDPEPDEAEGGQARDQAAKIVGAGKNSIDLADRVKREAPAVFEKMKAGKISLQDARRAVAAIPKDPWSDSEKKRKALVSAGKTVLANAELDKNLVAWAESKGLALRIDRGSKWGNPFILDADGDRDTVCDSYEKYYLPRKPSILEHAADELKGKVLVCHCFPERCHGLSLLKLLSFGP